MNEFKKFFSHRNVYYTVNLFLCAFLFISVENNWQIVTVYAISKIYELVLLNEINFNKVNTNIEIKK